MAQIAGQGSQCAGGCPFISHTLVFKDGNSTEDVAALTKQPPEKKYKIISIYRFFANMSTLFKCLVICSINDHLFIYFSERKSSDHIMEVPAVRWR